MHSEGVTQLGIECSIPWRQPHWYAAVDADEIISPWSMVDRWSIQDNYVLFLRRSSKIVYRQAEEKKQYIIYHPNLCSINLHK